MISKQQIRAWFSQFERDQKFYVEFLDKLYGKVCTRLYIFKKTKANGIQYQEIFRAYLSKTMTSNNLYYSNCAGYIVNMSSLKDYSHGYIVVDNDPTLTDCMGCWTMHVQKYRDYTAKQAEEALKAEVPYFRIDEDTLTSVELMEYAREYKNDSKVERIAKAGVGYLYNSKRFKSLNKEQLGKVKWYLDLYGDYVKKEHPKISEILTCAKNSWSPKMFAYERDIKEWTKTIGFYNEELIREIYKYCEKKHIDLRTYLDYIEVSNHFHRAIYERGVIFPSAFRKQHDSLMRRYRNERKRIEDAKRKKELAEKNKIQENLKFLNKTLEKVNKSTTFGKIVGKTDLRIVIPKCYNDFVEVGDKLSICVGSYEYDVKMAKGKCLIIFIYKDDEPVECCELATDKKYKLLQLRGHNNEDSDYHADALNLVNAFRTALIKSRVNLSVSA